MHAFWLILICDLLEDRRIYDVIIKSFFPYILILYYIKQVDSKLPCVCSVIDHRWRQNVVRTSVTHWAAPRVPLFCSYHILTSSVIYYWTEARQLVIYLLNNACSLRHRYERAQFTIHFIKEIKKLVSRALLSYISTWELLRTLEKCEKHSPPGSFSRSSHQQKKAPDNSGVYTFATFTINRCQIEIFGQSKA